MQTNRLNEKVDKSGDIQFLYSELSDNKSLDQKICNLL
jgi:hypothetical protein